MPAPVPLPKSASSAPAPADDLWIVLPHLGAGGAQKVAVLAAAHFQAQGLRVRLVSFLPVPLAHALPEGVDHVDLGPAVDLVWKGSRWNRRLAAQIQCLLRALYWRLRSHVIRLFLLLFWAPISREARPGRRHPSVGLLRWCVRGLSGPQAVLLDQALATHRPQRVLAMLSRTNVITCMALWNSATHLVISERNDPDRQRLPDPWPRLQRLLYQRADVVTANTEGVMRSLAAIPGLQRLELLPNPLPALAQPSEADAIQSSSTGFVSVGRLVHQKGLDVLLEALARCRGAAASWPLVLVGDGVERPTLERQAAAAGLVERVQFAGFQRDPLPFLLGASVFVLPSRFEGMPNALLEAMAAGLAVVVSDASPGPLEVVEHRRSGLVVPAGNVEALAAALTELAADPQLCGALGRAARRRIASLDWPAIEPTWRSVLALP